MTHSEDPHGTPAADPLDTALHAAALDYHRPPPVPAEAMWAAIRERRAACAPTPAATPDAAEAPSAVNVRHIDHRADRRAGRGPVRRWMPLAAAAVLLLGVGIGVGRRWASLDGAGQVSGASVGATVSATVAARGGGERAPDVPRMAAPAPSDGGTMRFLRPRTRPTAPSGLAAAPRAPERADGAVSPLGAATAQHLAAADALLTAFAADERRDPRRQAVAAPDSAWARDLLTTTRLLLDSPASADPARRHLLEDLELVLVQLARLPRVDTPEERALIERAIRRGDLLSKLRTAAPAGAAAPTRVPGA